MLKTADGDLLSVRGKTDHNLCINDMEFATTVFAQLGILSGILRVKEDNRPKQVGHGYVFSMAVGNWSLFLLGDE